jgi:multicomponent Na+:H+ antiporter subunit F
MRSGLGTQRLARATSATWCRDVMPAEVVVVAFAWATVLLVAGGLLLLRASDSLHRLLALDVLGTIVIIVLTTFSYLNGVSYYIDAAIALALLSFSATLLTARYITRREGPD